MAEEERARFCDSCNSVIGWYATFCDACGMRIGDTGGASEGAPPSGDSREAASVEQDLYRAHLRLVHSSRESVEKIKKECVRITRSLKEIESHPRDPENRRKLIGLAERLVDLETRWDDLQHGYNRKSEGIEEEFLSKIDELEADIELSPHHQEAIEEEVGRFMRSLEEAAEEMRETGRFLDVVQARQNSGLLGFGGGGAATLIAGAVAAVLAAGGTVWGLVAEGLDPVALAKVVGPAWLALIVLFVHARSRGH